MSCTKDTFKACCLCTGGRINPAPYLHNYTKSIKPHNPLHHWIFEQIIWRNELSGLKIFGVVLWCFRKCHRLPKNREVGGKSKRSYIQKNPYWDVPQCKCIDKRIRISQIRGLKLDPVQNNGPLKLIRRLNLKGCDFGQIGLHHIRRSQHCFYFTLPY